ncbi:NAD(P)-binding protein [Streptacidiphilus sp. ASG 303]|uniref:NAD(P)-binding protein n=1 Tax=Streptacidiphilus sp. ASG 303 TaxID=2896847 RepID=UPI001E31E6DD|nr:NAD(P)-binding protein [Streptacidiphilus sp. ASG 303]MCD0485430.1 NAD(P)-binding protein [Streptacidiphilus sp. ASG 303]
MGDSEVDYLVVGAGAMGLAFADTLVAETGASVAIVDRHDRPGGHWQLAYPFCRLHQPSAGYGVNSLPLGSDRIDRSGTNAGLYELAGVDEIRAYYEQVMTHTLLPTGRVDHHRRTEYLGDGRCRSLVTGEEYRISARVRTVDATYQRVSVPAMRAPGYEVAPGVTCVPPNALVSLPVPPDRFTVVGGGKTAMDACLWLLEHGTDPDRITWIVPNDAWLYDRALVQPGPRFAEHVTTVMTGQLRAVMEADSVEDLFDRLEACGRLVRLDPSVRPTRFRCATVSRAELDRLRRIRHVVRLGRVRSIGADAIVLDDGLLPTTPGTVHVDCTADGLAPRPAVPVFQGDHITLQAVRTCQQVFSAALIAHVEAAYDGDDQKNRLCEPIPHPYHDVDLLHTLLADLRNGRRWAEDAELDAWLAGSRLDFLRRVGTPLPTEPAARAEATALLRTALDAAALRVGRLLGGDAPPGDPARDPRARETASGPA